MAAAKRLVRLAEVMSTTGLSRSEIYRLEAKGSFPKRVPIGVRTTAWDFDEVQEFIRARIADRERVIKKRRGIGKRLHESRMLARE